jgi:hypothetical protein
MVAARPSDSSKNAVRASGRDSTATAVVIELRSVVSQLLFVYGTLKRGAKNHCHLAGQHFVAAAQDCPGFELRDMGGCPDGAVRQRHRRE